MVFDDEIFQRFNEAYNFMNKTKDSPNPILTKKKLLFGYIKA